jgi:hypothetical protein
MSKPQQPNRDCFISAAGIVQAAMQSGPPREWRTRANYGLNLRRYFAHKLAGLPIEVPPIPESLKEKD